MSREQTNGNGGTVYRWAITTLVGLLCLVGGVAFSQYGVSARVIRNEVKIDKIEQSLREINTKLDLIIMGKLNADRNKTDSQ